MQLKVILRLRLFRVVGSSARKFSSNPLLGHGSLEHRYRDCGHDGPESYQHRELSGYRGRACSKHHNLS